MVVGVVAAFLVGLLSPAGVFAYPQDTGALTENGANSYTFTETGGGGTPTNCMKLNLPSGVSVTGISSGPGAPASTSTGFRAGAASGSNALNLTDGATASWNFTTNNPISNGSATFDHSATCMAGSDISRPVTGPSAAGPPPSQEGSPCSGHAVQGEVTGVCAPPERVGCLDVFDLPDPANQLNTRGLNVERGAKREDPDMIVTPREVGRGGVLTVEFACDLNINLRRESPLFVVLTGPGSKDDVYVLNVRVLGKRVGAVRIPEEVKQVRGSGARANSARRKKFPFGLFKFSFHSKKHRFRAARPVRVAPPPPPPVSSGPTNNACATPPPSTFLISPSHAAPGGRVSFLLSCTLRPTTLGFQGAFTPVQILIYDSVSFHNLRYVGGTLRPISPSFPVRSPIRIPPSGAASVRSPFAITVTLPSWIQPAAYIAVIVYGQGQVASQNELRVP